MNTSYENFKKENRLRLFGHEDAGKEREERLLSYYYKTLQYEDIVSDIDLQIVTGEKGTGKSALLKMAFIEAQESSTVPIWIRLDDLSELYTNILNCDDLYQLKTLWKKSISKLIVMKLASDSNFIYSEDYEKALQWAYTSGYASRDFISRTVKLFKPLYEKYISVEEHPESTIDGGFRVLKCDSSNMKDVYYNPADAQQSLFDTYADNIKEDRTPEDLLFQVMLDLGVLLSSKIEETTIAGKQVFNVADGFLIACFDKDVTEETVKAVAEKKPYYAVFRDSSMANDSVATNFDQIFASISPDTVRKVL